MYPVSAAFLAAVRQSHQVAKRLDVCTPDGTVLASLDATGGEVTIDARRSVRREASFTIPVSAYALIPAAPGDLLSPLSGNELRPYRGVTYDDGSTELVPLGVFPVRSSPPSMGEDGIVTITVGGQDRSSTVSRNRWTDVYSIPAGTRLEDAIADLLANRAPLYDVNFQSTGVTVPATSFGLEVESDPWADAQSLATAAGYDLYYDATGVAVLTQPTDPTTATPQITYANDALAVITSATKVWDAEKSYNGCIVIGEGATTAPVRGEAWDDDPSSPTYRLGAYGAYPEFLVTPLVGSESQATAAAQAQLARRRGVAQSLTWRQVVNPAHDANDAIAFKQSRLRINTAITVVLDALTIPWSVSDAMSAESRARQLDAGIPDVDPVVPTTVPAVVVSGLYGAGLYGDGLYG
jgi:hypothetical protein